MPSPFPGMNPYLEQETVWHDFHERFCPAVAEVLTLQVRPHFIVKIDEHVYIHELPEEKKLAGRGDVVDFERLSFIEVRDRQSDQIITILELLSPCNKESGPDREQYLAKRARLLASPVHLVEIDLLRGGPRLPMKRLPDCDYCALVSRVEERPRADMWCLHLRDRLPLLPVPLRAPHADAQVDLQQILDRIYDAAGYEDYIYGGQPQPHLSADDDAWARSFLPANQ